MSETGEHRETPLPPADRKQVELAKRQIRARLAREDAEKDKAYAERITQEVLAAKVGDNGSNEKGDDALSEKRKRDTQSAAQTFGSDLSEPRNQ